MSGCRARDRRVAGSIPGRSVWRIFFFGVNFLCRLLVSVPARVSAVARERPRSFCQNCRWQVTPNYAYTIGPTKSEWPDYASAQAQCGNLSGKERTRNLSGNIWPQSSQFAEPLWTDPGIKSGISVRELISTLKQTNKAQAGNEGSNILPKSSQARKKPPRLGNYASTAK